MFKLIVCLFVVVAVVGADYDFQDSDFNELLLDGVQSDYDDELDEALRFRRHTEEASGEKECKGKRERNFHCCTGEKPNPKQFEAVREIKKACIAEVRGDNAEDVIFDPFDCEKMQVLKEQMVCTAECMANKFKLLEEDGSLNRDALLIHLRAKIGDTQWKAEGLEGFVDKCLGELKSDEKKECNPIPLQMTHCIWREFVQGCPAELQVDNGKCKKIRERLAKGDTSYLRKSFLHHFHSHHDDKKDTN